MRKIVVLVSLALGLFLVDSTKVQSDGAGDMKSLRQNQLARGVDAYIKGDYVTALLKFKYLAAKQHAKAQFCLGFMYHRGKGTPKDYSKALRWYKFAAEQRHANAQHMLGEMYSKGEGVTKNLVQAYKWFHLAARSDGGTVSAGTYRDFIKREMTREEIDEAMKLSRDCVRKGYKKC